MHPGDDPAKSNKTIPVQMLQYLLLLDLLLKIYTTVDIDIIVDTRTGSMIGWQNSLSSKKTTRL